MYFAAAQVCEVDEQGGSGFTLAWSWSRLECGALEVTQREWWGVLGPLGRCLRLGCLKHVAESGMESGVEGEG
jgi:hypothetical protein